MRVRAFSLIELLVVVAIIAILAAILFPIFAQLKNAAYQYNATNAIAQYSKSAAIYVADNDDTYMLATYAEWDEAQAWFGRKVHGAFFFDASLGLLRPYLGKGRVRDHQASDYKDYMGDHSGFGYNWGYIGSDFNTGNSTTYFPNCQNAAHLTELARPSDTIVFATSAFYFAKWIPTGDGLTYDFGFIDAPRFWNDNPNVDFRHLGIKTVDQKNRKVTSSGNAVVALADGHVRTMRMSQMKNSMFERGEVENPNGAGFDTGG